MARITVKMLEKKLEEKVVENIELNTKLAEVCILLDSTKKELEESKARESSTRADLLFTNKEFIERSNKVLELTIELDSAKILAKLITKERNNLQDEIAAKKQSIEHLEELNEMLSKSFASMHMRIVKREVVIGVMALTSIILAIILFKH